MPQGWQTRTANPATAVGLFSFPINRHSRYLHLSITLVYRYLVPSSLATPTRGILQNEQTPGSTSHNHIWVTV